MTLFIIIPSHSHAFYGKDNSRFLFEFQKNDEKSNPSYVGEAYS